MKYKRRVAIGLSGGVDSAVSAALLVEQGYGVTGVFLECWKEPGCRTDEDRKDALGVALKLKIPFKVLDFKREYKARVVDYFYSEYKAGKTPNPDVMCNKEIKFGLFYDWAMKQGFDFVGTGHYARVKNNQLLRGVDGKKDQTYFLYRLREEQLGHILFPVGEMTKAQVRAEARKRHLPVADKPDSTGICFIGERNFKDFLSQYIESSKGNFVDVSGRVLGQHDGTCFYTLGQRKGMGIGGPGEAWFVVAKDFAKNEVILAQGQDHPALYADGLSAVELNWLIDSPQGTFKCKAKVRYSQPEQPCTVTVEGNRVKVVFDHPQRAMTQRQSVVFYDGEKCIGGGIIDEIAPNYFVLGRGLPEVLSV